MTAIGAVVVVAITVIPLRAGSVIRVLPKIIFSPCVNSCAM